MSLSERLMQEVAARRDDLVRLTQDLIAIPTLNPPGDNYLEICEYLDRRLSGAGFETQLIRAHGAPGDSDRHPRWNIIARREGSASHPCVHFNSHIDVVEVGHGWSVDPFAGVVKDGRIYGRGACDMKGGMATSIIAAEAFIAVCPDFTGAIEISGTADEESGGFGGVAYLAEQGFFSPERVDHVIIPEPLNKDRICLGHRGVWWAEIETSLFPTLAARRTEMPVVPDGARASTLNINSIHGGEPEQAKDYTGLPSPCVPDRCRMVIDRRFLIEEDIAEVETEIRDLLEIVRSARPGFDYEIRELHRVLPTMTERSAPVVGAVAQAVQQVFGRAADYVVSPGTYDQKHIDRIGRLKNCIAYGPGILDMAHKPDEYVGIDDMEQSAQVMALALCDLLGATAVSSG